MFGTMPSLAFTSSSRSFALPVADSGEIALKRDTVTLACSRLTPEEGQQVGVDLVLVCRREAVRRARIVNLLRALDQPGRFLCRVLDGNDLVVLTVQDQGRYVELLQVLGL